MIHNRPFSVLAFILGLMATAAAGAAQSTERDGSTPEKALPLKTVTPLGHVEVLGSGPVDMVLIPGLNMHWIMWEDFMERNADRYTMYAVTLPGFGGTPSPPIAVDQEYSDETWLKNAEKRIAAMIEERDLKNPVVVGHDLGARIAMRIGINYPDLVSMVVNVDALPAMPLNLVLEGEVTVERRKDFIDNTLAMHVEELPEPAWQTSQREHLKGQMHDQRRAEILGGYAGLVPKAIGARYFLEMASSDDTEAVMEIEVPLLVIAAIAREDAKMNRPGFIPTNWQPFYEAAEDVANITVVPFYDSDHYVTEDAPEDLDRAIWQFINGQVVEPRLPEKQPANAGGN